MEEEPIDIYKLIDRLENIGYRDYIIIFLMLLLALFWFYYNKDLNECNAYYQGIMNTSRLFINLSGYL